MTHRPQVRPLAVLDSQYMRIAAWESCYCLQLTCLILPTQRLSRQQALLTRRTDLPGGKEKKTTEG